MAHLFNPTAAPFENHPDQSGCENWRVRAMAWRPILFVMAIQCVMTFGLVGTENWQLSMIVLTTNWCMAEVMRRMIIVPVNARASVLGLRLGGQEDFSRKSMLSRSLLTEVKG